MVSREQVMDVYEILLGVRLETEPEINSYMQEKDIVALRRRIILEEKFNPTRLEKCHWGNNPVSRQDIIKGYQYILGRGPESENVIISRLNKKITRQNFFSSVIRSREFCDKYQILLAEKERRYFWDESPSMSEEDVFGDLWNYLEV